MFKWQVKDKKNHKHSVIVAKTYAEAEAVLLQGIMKSKYPVGTFLDEGLIESEVEESDIISIEDIA